jgi:ParB/RepB/Spo0J family partition protein
MTPTDSVDTTTARIIKPGPDLRSIPLSQITVAEGFNPRGAVAEDAELQALAETMRERGCLQPIRVHAATEGRYVLVAGERRYRAAALAGLTEIPASVLTADSGEQQHLDLLTDAMVENELRCALNPVQRADGYKAMIDDGLTVRGVAERLGGGSRRRSREQRIKEHLAILALPEDLRERVAAGEIPLLAVKALCGLCDIHDDLARAAVTAATPSRDYEEPYGWSEIAETPLAIVVNFCEQLPDGVFSSRDAFPLDAFTLSEKATAALAAYRELTGRDLDRVRFTAEQVEQARALGAVHDAGWLTIIAGQDVADRLAEDHIAQALEAATRSTGIGATTSDATGSRSDNGLVSGESGEDADERLRRQASEERACQQEARDQARSFNLELGLLAFKHLTRVKADERVLRILASVDLGGGLRGVAARGARLSLPGWVTQTEQRNGKTKSAYLDADDAHRRALEFLDGAESPAEIAGRALTLIALAAFADENAIAQSRRSFYTLAFRGAWAAQAEQDLRAIVRERIKEGQLPALDRALTGSPDHS